ncbi:sensor histidine kinase [Flavisolibacter nicotianae]|uniref:sensor histidine kinase n=1 Tax=Flavisolibacter nicotianae TaxID=2364882 RepID=UPI0019692A0F|nr:histidine kinase [Flavisolibacter nicotianae]
MNQHPFIFSNAPHQRVKRHVAFWLFWAVFQGFLYAFISLSPSMDYLHRLPQTMLDSLLFLPIHIFLSYALMYFVIPVYVVRNKYLSAALWTFAFILATALLSSFLSIYVVLPVREAVLPQGLQMQVHTSPAERGSFHLAFLAGLRGGITVGGLAAAIKLMKHWYVEGQRNLQLQKVAVESQLQLLKAQVHPHFLFNTLNNIFSFTQNTSPAASRMVMGLSDILRYMLYECNQPLVPLEKELKMIDDYIGLETIRYGNRLDLHVDFPGEANGFSIAPLLLLPFVENCFKHGISNMLEQPWLNLQVSITGNLLAVQLVNSKAVSGEPANHPGLGIENVRRRLQLLYPGKHELSITSEDEVFIVNLKLELERMKGVAVAAPPPAMAILEN